MHVNILSCECTSTKTNIITHYNVLLKLQCEYMAVKLSYLIYNLYAVLTQHKKKLIATKANSAIRYAIKHGKIF